MLELLVNPKRAEKKPWEMFFVGFFYACISILIPYFVFKKDYVNSQYISWISILFLVVLVMPYVYFTFKIEEDKDREIYEEKKLLEEHGRAVMCFLWLFLGFVIAFSVMYIVMPQGQNLFRAQIETFCQINKPDSFNSCVEQYGIKQIEKITGQVTSSERFLSIFSNNVYVLIFTLVFSLLLGAGAVFILAWNASVIAAAIGIFTSSELSKLPLGVGRYMIHGLPEIAAYFVAALAGGILGVAIIKKDFRSERFWKVLQDALYLIIIALIILIISASIEVFITPKLF